jgi:hypothetical protein
MLKIFTDFNARSADGTCWNLIYDGAPVSDEVLKVGEKIILFQDEDDFEVEASVEFRFVKELGRDSWVAVPDWATKRSVSRA